MLRQRYRSFSRRTRAGGMLRKLVVLFVLAAIVVALAPTIIASTPLLKMLLAYAAPPQAMTVSAESASLSWIGASSLSGLTVKDTSGKTLVDAPLVRVDRPLAQLALNPRSLGTIEITEPTIYVTVRPDGSNVEDVLSRLVEELAPDAAPPTDDSAQSTVEAAVRVAGGTLVVTDATSGRKWSIQKVNLSYDLDGASDGFGHGTLNAEVAEPGPAQPGRLNISLVPGAEGRRELRLELSAIGLSVVEPWLQRFAAGTSVAGAVSGQGVASWTATQAAFPTDLKTSGMFVVERLDATTAALEGDRVRLARVEMPWQLIGQPSGLAIEDLQLRTDIGRAAVRGRLDPRVFQLASMGSSAPSVATHHSLEMRSTVDVARVANMLPNAIGIRAGTTITAGTIDIEGRYLPTEGGQQLTASIKTAQLAATSGGQALSWDEPLSAQFALRRIGRLTHVDSLQFNSQFLTITSNGTPERFTADARFDLYRLAEQLGQFVDLSGTKLEGTGAMTASWQRAGADRFTSRAEGELSQLRMALGGGETWEEPHLALEASAEGSVDPLSHVPTRVEKGQLQVAAEGDALEARLAGAVDFTDRAPMWPVDVTASGSIARWLTRARPWFSPGEWRVDGACELAARVRVSPVAFEATDTRLQVNNLQATSPGWNIREARLEFAGDAHWDGASGEVASNSIQLVTSTVSLAAKDVRFGNGGEGRRHVSGVGAFRADVARLAGWRSDGVQQAAYQPKGEFTGNIRFARQGDVITGEFVADGSNLSLAALNTGAAGTYQTIWQEPKVSLRGNTTYDPAADRIAFDQVLIQSNTLQAMARGQVEQLSTLAECNITGAINYDLAQVTPLLAPYVGRGVQLTGREQARFALAGKLNDAGGAQAQLAGVALGTPYSGARPEAAHWSRRIRAQLELPWSGANVYGLPIGGGRLSAVLGDGGVRVEPIDLAVAEGRLTATPSIRFDPEPSELLLPAGPVLTNVRISPEVSEAMLKYVAPILAGTTQSEGHFSLELQGARVPLANSKKADAAGRLTVHSVRVVPGPMAREIVGIAQQIEALTRRRDPSALATQAPATLLSISDQQVNFRVVEGRVHHQNLEFQVGDIVVRSQGSVGLDESLALTMSVPIQDRWIEREPLLAGLKGQSLQVPVGGTLARPQLDRRAVASLSAQLLQNAAGQAVGGEINKALDKLFKPRQ